ncbi:MAG: hypothetical protein QW228_05920, partial [Candidatus Aenigmatarchaeota archaeon]
QFNILRKTNPERTDYQFIVDEYNNRVIAVATTKHCFVSQARLREEILAFLNSKGYVIEERTGFYGSLLDIGKVRYFKLKMQISFGDTLTYKAVRTNAFLVIENDVADLSKVGCMNPISFLKTPEILRESTSLIHPFVARERKLRVGDPQEFLDKIKQSIEKQIQLLKNFAEKQIDPFEQVRNTQLTEEEALVLVKAVCFAYKVSEKATTLVWINFKKDQEKTQWGLAMAFSQIAKYTHLWRSPYVSQHLSSIAGALLLIKNKEKAIEKCKQYLEQYKSSIPYKLWV